MVERVGIRDDGIDNDGRRWRERALRERECVCHSKPGSPLKEKRKKTKNEFKKDDIIKDNGF